MARSRAAKQFADDLCPGGGTGRTKDTDRIPKMIEKCKTRSVMGTKCTYLAYKPKRV